MTLGAIGEDEKSLENMRMREFKRMREAERVKKRKRRGRFL